MDQQPTQPTTSGRPDDCCWICLEGGADAAPCKCSQRPVHKACIARWQLERLGDREEHECRFCNGQLPPWQDTLLPPRTRPAAEALVNVHGPDGTLHRIPLAPGLAGRRRFLMAVRSALRLPAHVPLEMSFELAVPGGAAGGAPPRTISTSDFSLASRIASVNAGIRRAGKEAGGAGAQAGPEAKRRRR
ncbi:hypothetical protein HYH03_004212 [Edaphochlamys debaryana]|uniref:RING-CH-type domain-containing protein n=1 Tax=Edaphochlamys debaryana TaxID=47281 RepID=A0A836C2M6_9CHLO|nr:hypothetical protein HYH03_004212 [Edaphochlamys debaryana]|eukprot:KAG2497950.1 hypothetical protein HYH03_004212 [Edaphochlamys debaryana]